MSKATRMRGAALVVLVAGSLLTPGAASASNGSIIAKLRAADPTITRDERNIANAATKFKSTHKPGPVRAAISREVRDLKRVTRKVAAQSASNAKGRQAKVLIIRGLTAIRKAYQVLGGVFANGAKNPKAVPGEISRAQGLVKKGRIQFFAGQRLLGLNAPKS